MLKVDVYLCAILSFYLGNCQFEDFKTVTEMIIECGENVRRVIQEPEYDSRPYVIRELAKYYHLLDHVEEKLRHNDHDGMEILQALYNQGGPPHLNIHIDYDALQKRYKFKEDGMRDIRTLMADTKELWEKLLTLLAEGKKQVHRQNIQQEYKEEASREQVVRSDDGERQIDLMNNVEKENKGQSGVDTMQHNDTANKSTGQIDLITNHDNEEDEEEPANKNNNDDETEQMKQNDWFNEEK